MRRSQQIAKRAAYSLFPLSLSAKKQADREARGFVKGAYFCVRDRRQNASATKVCAAYSLSKPKGAYFCVSYRRQNASATKVCAAYSLSKPKGAYICVSYRRQNASATKVCAAYSLSKPKGAYFCVRDRDKTQVRQRYCAVYFSTSGLSLSESVEASKTRRASIYRRGAYYAYVTQGKRSTTSITLLISVLRGFHYLKAKKQARQGERAFTDGEHTMRM